MNLDTKTGLLIIMGLIAIFGWNYILIQRDNKMFDTLKQRNAELCAMLHEGHPDCNGVKR